MISISQIRLPAGHKMEQLEEKIRRLLRLKKNTPFTYEIRKRSVDARKKPKVLFVYQVWVSLPDEDAVLGSVRLSSVQKAKESSYRMPECGREKLQSRPVIIGAGPAGLFCAYLLSRQGFCPIIIERGKKIEDRKRDVEHFWESGVIDPDSNVQFGEGGAGTFSDGKLNTGVKDVSGRIRMVLETFVSYGAPAEILYESKPHIGTDILLRVIAAMRDDLISAGCEFSFETKADRFLFEDGKLCAVSAGDRQIKTQTAVLAIGHSARDTFIELNRCGIAMEPKNFAVGFRVEHPQRMIDEAMYGSGSHAILPAAPYKLASNFPNGRSVYSFCMCPGGYVVNASSGQEQTAVNGMSYSGRSGENANSAIIISVTPNDFGESGALAGMHYQMELERNAYRLGNGRIPQQLYGDYCGDVCSTGYGSFASQAKGACVFANLRGLFSEEMERTFLRGMDHFSRIIPQFDRKDAILSGVESRTSSPVRILRNECFESNMEGIYPCGEGAGYAGGIVSAAVDGIKTAEALICRYHP